jgi:hypothetical protein
MDFGPAENLVPLLEQELAGESLTVIELSMAYVQLSGQMYWHPRPRPNLQDREEEGHVNRMLRRTWRWRAWEQMPTRMMMNKGL